MGARTTVIAAMTLGTILLLTGCTPDSPEPVQTIELNDLESDQVTIAVGEILSIDADEHPDAYRAIVIDASVGEFIPGKADPDTVNPSVRGVAPGETEVVLSDPTGELDEVSFTLTVTD